MRFLPPIAALDGLTLLVRRELWWAAHFLPSRRGPRPTFAGPRAYEVAFKPGEPAKHSKQLDAAVGAGRMLPDRWDHVPSALPCRL